MSDDIENLDEMVPEIAGPALPHPWRSVLPQFAAAVAMLLLALVLATQFLLSRPYDLRGLSRAAADDLERFLVSQRIPQENILKSEPALATTDRAHVYRISYDVELPDTMSFSHTKREIEQALLAADIGVAPLMESGQERGVELSIGGVSFATLRLHTTLHAPAALNPPRAPAPERESRSEPTVAGVTAAPLSTDSPAPSAVTTATAAPKPEPGRAETTLPETESETVQESARFQTARSEESGWSPPLSTPLFPRGSVEGGVRLAIILDDGGYGGTVTEQILAMDPRLTLSILPNTPFAEETARRAGERGFEVMLHLPMDNMNGAIPHEGQLEVEMPADEIQALTLHALAQVPGAVGINNHTGSRFTTNSEALGRFMGVIADLPLFFVDSRTTVDTRALAAARTAGIPAASRDVFIDHDNDEALMRKRFNEAVQLARDRGYAVAIAHFRPMTVRVLNELIGTLPGEGITLTHMSELVE